VNHQSLESVIHGDSAEAGSVTTVLYVSSCRFRKVSAHVFWLLGKVHGGHPVASAGEVLSRVARIARTLPAEDQGQADIIKPHESAFPIIVALIKARRQVRATHDDVAQWITHVTPQRRYRVIHGEHTTTPQP
jgi:hypothetical protein